MDMKEIHKDVVVKPGVSLSEAETALKAYLKGAPTEYMNPDQNYGGVKYQDTTGMTICLADDKYVRVYSTPRLFVIAPLVRAENVIDLRKK